MQIILHSFRAKLTPILFRLFAFVLLFGMVLGQVPAQNVQAAGETLSLTKTIDGNITNAKVGDTILYRIHFACSSLTTDCGELKITDTLPIHPVNGTPLFTYVATESKVSGTGGSIYTISETGGVVTITSNNFKDGSQADAVIALRVRYDVRTLPVTFTNTASGQIKPVGASAWSTPIPATSPNLTIDGVAVDWNLTKTLYSPSINPTVDTDVTYRLNLCPAGTSGNVAFTNITMTDTLPAGAVFVSASDSGAETSPGSGIVTWTVAGTFTPPSCATRYVTIRYPTPTFKVTDSLTNTAGATADYTPSSGTCTTPCISYSDPITHDIIDIVEVPTYRKDDAGDPVGISGTARFILTLDTNGTNYPANAVTLIDNLPPELKVTSVTSGTWSNPNVRATVQYSTDIGANWINFTAPQPVGQADGNQLYEGLLDNITNIRWVFEYDSDPNELNLIPGKDPLPGLPYDWSFSVKPEIRVAPRAADAHATDGTPGTLLPKVDIATLPQTYNNCLQVSRIDSSSTSVLGNCNNEDMTVRGNYVSLRTFKSETPGIAYDPNESVASQVGTNFHADTTIMPNDMIHYVITVEVTERSSANLINPTIQDTLPPELVFMQEGTAQLDGSDLPAAQQPSFAYDSGTGKLTWAWNTPANPLDIAPIALPDLGSKRLTVDFYARVPPGTPDNTYTNGLYVVTDSVDARCEIGTTENDFDNGNVDQDAPNDTTDPACRNNDTFKVERAAALRGEKWIRSVNADNAKVALASTLVEENFTTDSTPGICPDGSTAGMAGSTNTFTRYPCVSQAFPEGALGNLEYVPPPASATLDDFEYNLRIFNEGNVPMLKYVLYDILPYYGDTGSGGALTYTARASEFRPILRGPIEFLQGLKVDGGVVPLITTDFTIQYNDTTNPCRPEVFDKPIGTLYPAGCSNVWTANWATARSYRIRLNNDATVLTPNIAPFTTAGSELRFGIPMYIPKDSPTVGVFNQDDAQTREIAWNSFSHVGSYDKDAAADIQNEDLLASEPRKVGITIPERFSIGNRVWRDSDNNGTINPPDDADPGIAGVTVNLYSGVDADLDGKPDDLTVLDTTITDAGSVTTEKGYYLFSNLPAGNYIIGIPASNFAADPDGLGPLTAGPLFNLRSSTGTPADTDYTNPPETNPDINDHGIDPLPLTTPSTEVFSHIIPLVHADEEEDEADLSDNDRDGPAGTRRGLNAELDNNSDLTVDFGFFGGTDIPFSIGNHLWYDDGKDTLGNVVGTLNDGIRQDAELPVKNAKVNLYRDGDLNGPDADELIRWDTTDDNGFYLFDNLDPGRYYVQIDATNFQTSGILVGWYSSQPTGTELTYVTGNNLVHTPFTDSDDNGIDNNKPWVDGITSGMIELERGTDEALSESHLSGETDPDPDLNLLTLSDGINPTEWDGPVPGSRGRYGESDATSNLTVDFGFIPPMSLGNRVWFDNGNGETAATFRTRYNNSIMDVDPAHPTDALYSELGVNNVLLELWLDTNVTAGLQRAAVGSIPADTQITSDTTDTSGYYLFDPIPPTNATTGKAYYIHIPATNFATGNPLRNYISSFDRTAPADDKTDINDNGIDNATPATNGITSQAIVMTYGAEPKNSTAIPTPQLPDNTEIDLSANAAAYGTNNVGLYNQTDDNSNLTMDFGFVRAPRSLGNRLWFDTGVGGGGVVNDGIRNGTEPPVVGARVSLYRDNTGTAGVPDDVNGDLLFNKDDAIAYDNTDSNGYYLFDNLPPGRYIVGVDYANFAGGVLNEYASSTDKSTGVIDNAANNTDSLDNGKDRILPGDATASPYGVLSTSINLSAIPLSGLPTTETGSGDVITTLGNNPTAGDGIASRGRYGEINGDSDLTIDFGFFKPMSIGNRVFYDTGATTGHLDNGVMDTDELPVAGVSVQLWRETNATPGLQISGATPDIRAAYDSTPTNYYADVTDTGGYYLFDRLVPGNYYVYLPASNFTGTGKLTGLYSSTLTFNNDVDVNDNGVNNFRPDLNGISSELVTLGDNEPLLEAELSGEANPGILTNGNFSPTGWDGDSDAVTAGAQGSRGRWNESDVNSNLTVDFGFIPPLSLGNRVWLDNGSTATSPILSQFDDGLMNASGNEPGINGVNLSLYYDANNDGTYDDNTGIGGVDETAPYATTITANNGYYLFDNLPAGRFYVEVDSTNFTAALNGLISSSGVFDTEIVDINDNGQDDAAYAINGIRSVNFILKHGDEPLTPSVETDLPDPLVPANITAYGPNLRGRFGELDANSNLTLDFGFIALPRSLGNRLWYDTNNNGVMDGGELPVENARVSLYIDSNNDGAPDGAALATDITDAVTTPGTGGFYLFENLPPGRYLVGVDNTNFQATKPLFEYTSSTGNQTNNTDSNDNGVDRILPDDATASPYGVLSNNVNLTVAAPTLEADLSNNPADGAPDYRGNNGETDANSDLTIDFGFFKPMSLGNRVFKDNGAGTNLNNGIMDSDELPIQNVRVELYRDNGNGTFGAEDGSLINFDMTDAGGYYLFDRLDPGSYFVHIPLINFTTGVLQGMNNSAPDGTELVGVTGNTHTPTTDSDDNGVYDTRPDTNGITSGIITLALTTEPNNESELSGETDPGVLTNGNINPTGWDGDSDTVTAGAQGSRGRFGEANNNSNLTIDFGFLPVYSLGNRVWYDTGATPGNHTNGKLDGDELGIDAITVNLYLDTDNDGTPNGGIIATDLTAGGGYYRFDNLIAGNYIVEVVPPAGFGSTVDLNQDPDGDIDSDDDGVLTLPTGQVRSKPVTLGGTPAEPTAEEPMPLNPNSADGEAPDAQSNRSVDFGFVSAVAIGNVVWYDIGAGTAYNNGILDIGEFGVNGVTVNLYTSAGTLVATTTTSGGGYYQFDQLIPGTYYIEIPNTEFLPGLPNGELLGYTSSTGSGLAEDVDHLGTGGDENGRDVTSTVLTASGIRSMDYILTSGGEPNGTTDDETSYAGTLLDDSINFTADFGFTKAVAIGNRVWLDTGTGVGEFNNGKQDGLEAGVLDVTVQLFSPGADGVIGGGDDVLVATTSTDTDGDYVFDGLMPGDYYVHIPAAEFKTGTPNGDLLGYSSSVGQGSDETIDQTGDENGSDSKPSVNGVSSPVYHLTLDGQPVASDGEDQTGYPGVLDDNDVNYTADFGFTALVAIGDVVWIDTGAGYNNGIYEPADENGVNGVTVNLYYDADNSGTFDGTELTPYRTTQTVASVAAGGDGYYEFDKLTPGRYYVGIPAAEFNGAEQLVGYTSSTGSGTTEDKDDTVDENGQDTDALLTSGIRSMDYVLNAGAEPTDDDDEASYSGNLDDYNVNFTADFGFTEAYSLGNRVWFDNDKNGLRNGLEVGLDTVTVNLYSTSRPAFLMTTSTSGGGFYRFDNLVADTYIVEVVPPTGYASTIDAGDPDTDADDDDDNGVNFSGSNVRSDPVTLGTGNSEPEKETNPTTNPEILLGEAPDARSNRTVDFGFIISTTTSNKQLTATDQTFTDEIPVASRPVAIGEILTYVATLNVPSGETLPNLSALDTLAGGLAFVDCDSISAPNLTTKLAGGFSAACNPDINPTVTPQTGGYNDASQTVFSLGDVTNSTADTQTLTLTYRVIVLDISSNVNGVGGLNNSIVWSWDGATPLLPAKANPVKIVEPDLSIDKKASPRNANYGSTIHFTIDIAHTAQSSIDAFDVVVTDVIPTGLTLDPASILVTGTASTPGNFVSNFDLATNTLTVTWEVFRLKETARITFDAIFVGPAPIVNSANVAWTSLPIDPQPANGLPVPRSEYNDYAHERWYDPASAVGVDDYAKVDSVSISLPVPGNGDKTDPMILPATGFAPNVITQLPPMPAGFAYAQTEILLEIPKLKQTMKIAGVPYNDEKREWNLTWLNTEAGWLENTAFPTHAGNSALTAHTTLSNGQPGPFAKLDTLSYGDQVIVHLEGQKYIFEVRDNKQVKPSAVKSTLTHEEYPWLTLLTCKSYNEQTGEYTYRTAIRAVLVEVVDE